MPFVHQNGVRLFYTVDGPDDAPALMLSNSMGTTYRMWDVQMPALAERFRVIRYDRRGHGQSDSPPAPYALDDLGGDALAVMDAAGAERVHWLGLSMGGMVGMWLATNHPGRIGKVILCSAATYMGPPELWDGRIRTAQSRGMEVLAAPTMQRWFTANFLRNGSDKVAEIREQFLQTTVDGFCGSCAAMRDMDQRETIRSISAPTLIMVGAEDQGTTPTEAAFIVSRIPDARGVILRGSHIINVEAPQLFTETVLDFLG